MHRKGVVMKLSEIEAKDLVDYAGKAMAFAAGYLFIDMMLKDVSITPDFIKPFAGILVGIGAGILAARLVKS